MSICVYFVIKVRDHSLPLHTFSAAKRYHRSEIAPQLHSRLDGGHFLCITVIPAAASTVQISNNGSRWPSLESALKM